MNQQQIQQNLKDKVLRENIQLPAELFNFMLKACVDFGVRFNSREDFENMIKAVQFFLVYTPAGNSLCLSNLKDGVDAKTLLSALGLSVDKADKFCKYYPNGRLNDESRKLDHDYVSEVHGWIYQGRIMKSEMIEVDDVPDEGQCDHCGGVYPVEYCLSNVRVSTGSRDRLLSMCNYCRLRSEDSRIRDTATSHTCGDCQKDSCQFNPNRIEQRQLLNFNTNGVR